jgi:hypothetical protein
MVPSASARLKVPDQRVDVALDHRDDADPLDREVAVHQAVAEADDRTQVRDPILDRIIQPAALCNASPIVIRCRSTAARTIRSSRRRFAPTSSRIETICSAAASASSR